MSQMPQLVVEEETGRPTIGHWPRFCQLNQLLLKILWLATHQSGKAQSSEYRRSFKISSSGLLIREL
jgi:hypothetical protein